MKRTLCAAGLVALGIAVTPAAAGIADSPVPLLMGQKAQVLYSVPGVINAGSLGTYFSCTSAAKTPSIVAVEVFQDSGGAPLNDASATSLSVPPGATVMLATEDAVGFVEDSFLLDPLSPPAIAKGSARILSTSTSLICDAFVSDAVHTPPVSMRYLTIVAKTKQKAAN
jgi:hypothetical protein